MSWQRFVRIFLGIFLGTIAGLYLVLLLIDPYDVARHPRLPLSGIADNDPRTATASRARDPHFDAAIVGNSRGQLISPSRLSAATGHRWVQLTVPGSGPSEQLAIMRAFLRSRSAPAAIVLAVDETWCSEHSALTVSNPFPFWLYDESQLPYFTHLLSFGAINLAIRRVAVQMALRAASPADGYWDYEQGRIWNFRPAAPAPAAPEFPSASTPPARFPAIDLLTERVRASGAVGRLVVVVPPVYVDALPRPASRQADTMARCKAAFRDAMARLPAGSLLDFYADTPPNRDPHNFMDATHYRAALARMIESEIAATLAEGARQGR